MSTVDSLQQEVVDMVARRLAGPVAPDDSFALLGIDSVGMAEISFDLERQHEIRIGEDIVCCQTVGDLIEYVRERKAAGREPRSANPRLPR